MKKILIVIGAVVLALVVLPALVITTGIYNVAADASHTSVVYWALETARERSVAVRAADIDVPSLDDPEQVRSGAGNYDSMCKGCHLAPGMAPTEMSEGLYPAPPNLSKHARVNAAQAFWTIKHGIKATGMPAWGRTMEDQYIWDLVAFLRKLPSLDAQQYSAEVNASGEHSHGREETPNEPSSERDAISSESQPHTEENSQHAHQ